MRKSTVTNILVGVLVIGLLTYLHLGVTAVWNDIMPRVFGLPEISGWDLLGMAVIATWIFPKPTINTKK